MNWKKLFWFLCGCNIINYVLSYNFIILFLRYFDMILEKLWCARSSYVFSTHNWINLSTRDSIYFRHFLFSWYKIQFTNNKLKRKVLRLFSDLFYQFYKKQEENYVIIINLLKFFIINIIRLNVIFYATHLIYKC